MTLQSQLDIAKKKYKEAQELGKKIGSPVAVVRGELAWWKKNIGNLEAQMKDITELYLNAPNEMKKMFDLSSKYYQYEGSKDNDRAIELINQVFGDGNITKKTMPNKSIRDNAYITDSDVDKLVQIDVDRGKDEAISRKAHKETQRINNLKRQEVHRAWGGKITGKMWGDRMNDLTKEALSKQSKNVLKIKKYKETILNEETTMIGHARLQNQILLEILTLTKENIENAKLYRTASLMHFYKIKNNKQFDEAVSGALKTFANTSGHRQKREKENSKKYMSVEDSYMRAITK